MRGLNDQFWSWAAKELKYWEQAALEKVSSQPALSANDIDELVKFFIEDAGLAPISTSRPKLTLAASSTEKTETASYRLNRLFNLSNVNALPPGQEIRFGPQLTLVYGNNGAGKSGYARALGSAGFARGKREVLPNATGTESKQLPQADIEILCPNAAKVVRWVEGKRCSELDGFYLFDRGSLAAHLTGSISLSFTPGSLSVLTRLADVTDLVRERVHTLINQRKTPNSFPMLFEGDSEVKTQLTHIDENTSIERLRSLGALNDDERAVLTELERQIAGLRLLDVPKQIERRGREITDLRNLIIAVQRTNQLLGDTSLTEANELINNVRLCREELGRSGVDQFKSEQLSAVGSQAWRNFIIAAKVLADAESKRGTAYPSEGDHCLLCWQTLPNDAIELLRKFWAFLKSNAQTKLNLAEQACTQKIQALRQIDLNYFASDSNARRILDEEFPIIIPAINAQVDACRERRQEIQDALTSYEARIPVPLIHVDLTEIRRLTDLRVREVNQLQGSDTGMRLAAAEKSFRELKHRQILGQHIQQIERDIQGRKWARRAEDSLGSTRAITTKYNDLFQQIVTERYRKLFEETLKRFRGDIKVTIETRGFKGETLRQIVLSPKAFRPGFSVDQILSEGEKQAVAMSDFLTEAALDPHNNAVILDDPVTSLDDKWKGALATCLAELAKHRQVVIFTHDLTFLYRIKERAEQLQVDFVSHWVREENGHPGFMYLNNSPVCEKDFKSAALARECYTKAKNAPPADQQALLQQGFGALRTSYEALIVFEIFNGVVPRFGERITFGALNGVRVDPKLNDEIILRMETLSRYIEGHLHSDAFASVKPTPDLLLEEINMFESVRKVQKELKKASVQPASLAKAESGRAESETKTKPVAEVPALPKANVKTPAN